MRGLSGQPYQKDAIEYLYTNYQSPHKELFSTVSRMARSTYQRHKQIRKSTTISIFSQYQEGDSPENRKTQYSVGLLRKVFHQVYLAQIFINSLKNYQRQQSPLRSNSSYWKREFILPFYPDDFFIVKWKGLMRIVTFCTVIIYPIYICYLDLREQFDIFILITGIIFFCDMFVNCVTCSIDENYNLITDIKQILMNYFRTWFIVDLLATIPFDDTNEEYVGYFRLLRVISYFFNNKIVAYKGQANHVQLIENLTPHKELILQTGTKYLINVGINACLLIHIFGCFQHFFFDQYDYITTIYWATETITTVGYGDLADDNELLILWMIVGVSYYFFTIGDFALMMLKSKANQESDMLFSIEQLGNSQDLPEKLKQNCLNFIKNNLDHTPLWLEEYKSMVKHFPYQIKNYITVSSQLDLCLQIPFFLYDINYTQLLLESVHCIQVEEGQQLYREGQGSSEIYFLLKGDVRIMTKDKGILLNILEGTMFGEFEAIEEKLRGTYCVAQTTSVCIVIPFRILRKVMQKSSIIEFEVKQLHLRRRKLIIRNFIDEKGNFVTYHLERKLQYRKQNVRSFTKEFLLMTRQEYEMEKLKKQLLSISQYNSLLLQKVLGKKKQRFQLFLIKFQRSVQRIIEMNHLLDEIMPDQWKELINYQLIKRVFPKKYLQDKHQSLSISRKSSSVHSLVNRMKLSSFSQQYFIHRLPEVKLKHIVLQHIRDSKNKFISLEQVVNKYQNDPDAIYRNRKENIGRSKWNQQFTKPSQTIILRIDQVEECGLKYFSILQTMKTLDWIWLQGSMQKFELYQLIHGKEKKFIQ